MDRRTCSMDHRTHGTCSWSIDRAFMDHWTYVMIHKWTMKYDPYIIHFPLPLTIGDVQFFHITSSMLKTAIIHKTSRQNMLHSSWNTFHGPHNMFYGRTRSPLHGPRHAQWSRKHPCPVIHILWTIRFHGQSKFFMDHRTYSLESKTACFGL